MKKNPIMHLRILPKLQKMDTPRNTRRSINTSNIANAEENEDLGRIIGVLFIIEYRLKVGPKLLRNDLDWVILK